MPSPSIRNLGVVFDSAMTMTPYVTNIVQSISFQLRNIGKIRQYIDQNTCHNLIRALVLSRLDYCNSLLIGITKKDLKRLKGLQYRAAKLVLTISGKYIHGSPLLAELHWLPIDKRIEFKLLLYVF